MTERQTQQMKDTVDELRYRLALSEAECESLSKKLDLQESTWQMVMEIQDKLLAACEREHNRYREQYASLEDRFAKAEALKDDAAMLWDDANKRSVDAEARLAKAEEALQQIADYGHELDDYVLPPKQARQIARAALAGIAETSE